MNNKSPKVSNLITRLLSKFNATDLIGELQALTVNYPNINRLKAKSHELSNNFDYKGLRDLEELFHQELLAIREFNRRQHKSDYKSKRELLDLVNAYIGRKLDNDYATDERELIVKKEAL